MRKVKTTLKSFLPKILAVKTFRAGWVNNLESAKQRSKSFSHYCIPNWKVGNEKKSGKKDVKEAFSRF